MEITDRDIADMLEKTVEEILELKNTNLDAYEVVQHGVLCQKLSLTEEDLEKYSQKLPKEAETQE